MPRVLGNTMHFHNRMCFFKKKESRKLLSHVCPFPDSFVSHSNSNIPPSSEVEPSLQANIQSDQCSNTLMKDS